MTVRPSILLFLSVLIAAVLSAFSPALADTVTYQYDSLGRLTSVTHSTGATVSYVYDAAGNRKSYTSSGGTVVVLPLLGGLVIPLR